MSASLESKRAFATILLVGDDAAARRRLELMLRLSGYRVLAVADVADALEQARQHQPDLVLSDVTLAGAPDGFAFAERLRLDPRQADTPVVLMSKDAPSSCCVSAFDRGADDVVGKAVDFEELLARIRCHLRHAERARELRRRCTYDALTGALSRAAVEEELARELKRNRRTGLPVSVLMADLDGFKAINDRYGHAAGDDALRMTARTLTHLLRTTDRIGRVGGDEFLAVLPDTDAADAYQLMARIERAWCAHPPRARGVEAPVLVSMGTATASADESAQAVLRRADRAMYEAKQQRRGASPTVR
jgi:diguanylate cyclase (GGDEF)-like protein